MIYPLTRGFICYVQNTSSEVTVIAFTKIIKLKMNQGTGDNLKNIHKIDICKETATRRQGFHEVADQQRFFNFACMSDFPAVARISYFKTYKFIFLFLKFI